MSQRYGKYQYDDDLSTQKILLIVDFSVDSVVWGIDGDWMVNVFEAVFGVKRFAKEEQVLSFK